MQVKICDNMSESQWPSIQMAGGKGRSLLQEPLLLTLPGLLPGYPWGSQL